MNNLRKTVERAINDLDVYRAPNIDEARQALHNILMAAELGGIGDDTINSISIDRTSVNIHTSYSVRCCAQTASFHFPTHILDAEDPIKAAKIWGLTKKRDEAAARVKWDEKTLAGAKMRLEDAELKLKTAIGT